MDKRFIHNPSEKVSKQLGDGKLLSQLTKKDVVYNFRENDIVNGGQGRPLNNISQINSRTKKLNYQLAC